MTTITATAFSSRRACMICRVRYNNSPGGSSAPTFNETLHLREVKKHEIIHAYMEHRVFIKKGTRVCDAHYDDNGRIRKEEFYIIPTVEKLQSTELINDLLNECILAAKSNNNIFDKFKEFRYLDEEHCYKITGWTKNEFLEFSNHIYGIYDTKCRTKDQLIALYRYWLRNGSSQESLATLFGQNTSQRHISDYLDEIRQAIYKYFVPKYLSSKKTRDFYLTHNTKMALKLHDLPTSNLVLIADGTYHKIEKSANNEFQYRTYSGQKKDNLFKPFIVCCADGYIVECYGPFAANKNDATILDYIIENDNDFKNLLLSNETTLILDRGMDLNCSNEVHL
jgi:hypothetical protein